MREGRRIRDLASEANDRVKRIHGQAEFGF